MLTTIPLYPVSIDWYNDTVLSFSTRSLSNVFRVFLFGLGYNMGNVPIMVTIFLAVIPGALISMCNVIPL
jgi:hypothetical protein